LTLQFINAILVIDILKPMQLNNIVKFKRRNLTHTNNCVAFDDVAIGGRCEIF